MVYGCIVLACFCFFSGVMAVQEAWLPQLVPQFCKFLEPLELPPPTFDPNTSTIRCHMSCTYGGD